MRLLMVGLAAMALAGCVPLQEYDQYGQPLPVGPGQIYGQQSYGTPSYAEPGYAQPGYGYGYGQPYAVPVPVPSYGYGYGGGYGGGYGRDYRRDYRQEERREFRPDYRQENRPDYGRRDYGRQPDIQLQGGRPPQFQPPPQQERRQPVPAVVQPQPGNQGMPLPFPGQR